MLCAGLTVETYAVSYTRFFRELNKQTSTATATSALAVSVRYNFIHFFAVLYKAQHEKATFCVENVNYDGQFLELRFHFDAVIHVLLGLGNISDSDRFIS